MTGLLLVFGAIRPAEVRPNFSSCHCLYRGWFAKATGAHGPAHSQPRERQTRLGARPNWNVASRPVLFTATLALAGKVYLPAPRLAHCPGSHADHQRSSAMNPLLWWLVNPLTPC